MDMKFDEEEEANEILSDTGWDDEHPEESSDWTNLDPAQAQGLADSNCLRTRQQSYEILTEQDLQERQAMLVSRTVEQLFVSQNEAATLLRHYRWNIQKLINDWLDDSEKGPQAVFTTCPSYQCGAVIPDELQIRLLPINKRVQFKQWLLDGFVQGNRTRMKWCPTPDCDKIIEIKAGAEKEIECRCGYVFCFKCELEGHRPCSCELVTKWMEKNSTDSENVNWIIANTKRCPKCQVNIEKNQGCNHMTCRFCKYDFCWLCKGEWSKHGSATGGFYRCNKYEEAKAKGESTILEKEEQKVQEARNALQKYMFYFTRFDNHQKSIQFARKTRQDAEARMQQLRDIQGTNYQDVQFVLNAVNVVVACRRVLMWTYAYGFYVENANEKDIFEQHQERLEKFTEFLHGLSEKPIEELLDNKARSEIVNYTRVVLRYRDNVIKAIEQGLTSAQDLH